jgi:hypothetical protein
MKHCQEFVYLMEKVVPFIRGNHPRWWKSSDSAIANYCAWYWNRDLMSVALVGDECFAVCLIKLFDRLEEWLEEFPFNPTGRFCLIDLLVSASPHATAEVFETLFRRWGPQQTMIWERGERTEKGAPRMFTWEQYLKLTRRLTYGIVEPEKMKYG